MNALGYYDNISFEEKINANNLQIIITVSDKKTENSKIILNKTIPALLFIPLFILLAIIAIPFLIVIFCIKLISLVISFFKTEEPEMSYQETKAYFNAGKGYLNSLSNEDKKTLLSKRGSVSLGL